MAVREQSGDRPREKNMKTDNKNDKKVHLMAQELKLARVLAGNNKTSRDRALKSLKKWFLQRSKTLPFTDHDFQIIWKGLYFSMWMSDKPLIQEECAENIASLIHFETFNESTLFFKAGLTILINEWFGIDQLRLDKFLMLVRRLLRQMLIAMKNHGLSKKNIDKFSEILSLTILNSDIHPPVGLFMHFTEIFLEEVAKVTEGNIPTDRLVDFLRPFIKKLAVTKDGREIAHIRKFIFIYLIKQSKLGLEYQTKYEAWKREGFPGSIDSMQKIKLVKEKASVEEDTENKEKPLDPRAGRVDVELPQIKFKAKLIVNALQEYKFDKDSNSKSRNAINELLNHFNKMFKGIYPLGTKKVLDTENSYDTSIRKAANRLIKFDQKLLGKDKKNRKRATEKDEKEEVLPKRKKKNVEKDTANEGDLDEKEIEQDEGNVGKKTKKRKKNENRKRDADQIEKTKCSNGDDVTEEELSKFIAQSEGNLRKKSKRIKKNVERLDAGENGTDEKVSLVGENITEQLDKFVEENEGNSTKNVKKKKAAKKHQSNKTGDTQIELENGKEKRIKRKRKDESNKDNKEAKKKRRKRGIQEEIINNIECVFERNSGTWVVYDVSSDKEQIEAAPTQKTEVLGEPMENSIDDKQNPSTSSDLKNSEFVLQSNKSPSTVGTDLGSPSEENQTPSKNKTSKNPAVEKGSPKSGGISPIRLFETPQEKKELFPKSSWDEPLQDGEYEICIPSKKHIAKLKRQAKKSNQSVHELINISMKQIKGKGRFSLDPSLVKNPFSTPNSAKKVKINTKLNKSQEIHEHVQQILSSPGIPYDANKKPSKPLLKASASSTPVNPFYNKQLTVW